MASRFDLFCPSPWASGLIGGLIDGLMSELIYEVKFTDTKFMVRVGLEPGTFSTTLAGNYLPLPSPICTQISVCFPRTVGENTSR